MKGLLILVLQILLIEQLFKMKCSEKIVLAS